MVRGRHERVLHALKAAANAADIAHNTIEDIAFVEDNDLTDSQAAFWSERAASSRARAPGDLEALDLALAKLATEVAAWREVAT